MNQYQININNICRDGSLRLDVKAIFSIIVQLAITTEHKYHNYFVDSRPSWVTITYALIYTFMKVPKFLLQCHVIFPCFEFSFVVINFTKSQILDIYINIISNLQGEGLRRNLVMFNKILSWYMQGT